MTPAFHHALSAAVSGEVRFGEPLARYTKYRIGGPATAFVAPQSVQDVSAAIRLSRDEGLPWLVLGLGSNLLVSDIGFSGVVIRIGKGLDRVERSGPDGSRWSIGAGLPTPLLARQSAAAGHGGAQRLIGVPGTVGGGVFMNAGAHGQDFSQITRSVEVVDARGTIYSMAGERMTWRYRSSGLDGVVVVSSTVELIPGDPQKTKDELAMYLKKRREGTPFDEPCCGSVFRNPGVHTLSSAPAAPAPSSGAAGGEGAGERHTAGQLIEACGLKGFQIGQAQVSPKHANYIVNLGEATAKDVLDVIDTARERVYKEFGVSLDLEVKLIG